MAYLHFSFQTEIELQLNIPDSKLKDLLTHKIDIISFLTIDWEAIEKSHKIAPEGDDCCTATYPSESEISYFVIEKNNGSEYKWNGEKLTKI
jgi:hypothetical protein